MKIGSPTLGRLHTAVTKLGLTIYLTQTKAFKFSRRASMAGSSRDSSRTGHVSIEFLTSYDNCNFTSPHDCIGYGPKESEPAVPYHLFHISWNSKSPQQRQLDRVNMLEFERYEPRAAKLTEGTKRPFLQRVLGLCYLARNKHAYLFVDILLLAGKFLRVSAPGIVGFMKNAWT